MVIIILYYNILYHFIVYCITLYYIILHYLISYHIILYITKNDIKLKNDIKIISFSYASSKYSVIKHD